jgi:hypothetical protein
MAQVVINNGDASGAIRAALNAMFGELYTGKVKVNFAAVTAPTVTDDSAAGYASGSGWLRVDTGDFFRCRVATVGAAKWVKFDTADHPGYIPGNWHRALIGVQSANGAVLGNGSIRCLPFQIKQRMTISDLAAVITSASAGNNISLAIYANDPARGRPTGNALANVGSLSTTSTGFVSAACAGGNKQFEPGWYWIAVNADNGVAACQVPGGTSVYGSSLIGSASTTIMGATAAVGFTVTTPWTFGTWPDLTSAVWTETTTQSVPIMQYKIASVP